MYHSSPRVQGWRSHYPLVETRGDLATLGGTYRSAARRQINRNAGTGLSMRACANADSPTVFKHRCARGPKSQAASRTLLGTSEWLECFLQLVSSNTRPAVGD